MQKCTWLHGITFWNRDVSQRVNGHTQECACSPRYKSFPVMKWRYQGHHSLGVYLSERQFHMASVNADAPHTHTHRESTDYPTVQVTPHHIHTHIKEHSSESLWVPPHAHTVLTTTTYITATQGCQEYIRDLLCMLSVAYRMCVHTHKHTPHHIQHYHHHTVQVAMC